MQLRISHMLTAVLAAVLTAGSPDPASAEESQLAASADDGPDRVEWLWIDAGASYKRLLLRSFEADRDKLTAELIPRDLEGPAPSVAVGVKLWFLTVGVRGTMARLRGAGSTRDDPPLSLWSFDGELGFRAPLGSFEPFVRLAAGYSSFGSMEDAIGGLGNGLDIDGVNGRAGAGFHYYLTPRLSLQLHSTGELLFLSRKGVPVRDLAEPEEVETLNEAQRRILEADGSSAGIGYELGGGLAIHF